MKKNLTEIVFILDRSGSMSGLEADTIGGFNSMIEKQRKADGEALVSTVLFDNIPSGAARLFWMPSAVRSITSAMSISTPDRRMSRSIRCLLSPRTEWRMRAGFTAATG